MNKQKKTKVLVNFLMRCTEFEDRELIEISRKVKADDEKEWLNDFYERLIEQSEEGRSFCVIAYSIAKHLDNKEWAKEILLQGVGRIKSGDSWILCIICSDIVKELDDTEWATEIIKMGLEKLQDSKDQAEFGSFIIRYLKNEDRWGKDVLQKALNKADASDYKPIADKIVSFDKKWAEEIYQKAYKNSNTSIEFCDLAHSVYHKLEDLDWAAGLYKESLDKAEEMEDYTNIIIGIYNSLDDINWMAEIYKIAKDKAKNYHDYSVLIESKNRLGIVHAQEMLIEIYEGAVEKIDNYNDYKKFEESIKKRPYFGKKWIKSVLKKQPEFYLKKQTSYYLGILGSSILGLGFYLVLTYFVDYPNDLMACLTFFIIIFIFNLITKPLFDKIKIKK